MALTSPAAHPCSSQWMLADGAGMSEWNGEASPFVINPFFQTCHAGRRQGNLCSPCGSVYRSRDLVSRTTFHLK